MQTVYSFAPALQHLFPDHPESPSRLDLLEFGSLPLVTALPFTPATPDQAARVHSPAMLDQLEAACSQGAGLIDSAPTYITRQSYALALLAAGATLAVTRAVQVGLAQNGFAIVRPPGHHAEPGRPMGFCLLNNIAIAAQAALDDGLARVMIVDFDAHHGNGTEKAFWNEPRAAYFSTHQENIYPGSGSLQAATHARGRIGNFPLPAYSGDECFDQIFELALAPLVKKFKPHMLFVSAGFDAHWSDPLTSLGLSSAGFFRFSDKLTRLADQVCAGKIVFVLEGGYDPQNLANGVRAVFAALSHHRPALVNDASPWPEPDISGRLQAFRAWHALSTPDGFQV